MTLSETELTRRKAISTLQVKGGYVTTENVCKSIGVSFLTAKRFLNDLIAKGLARKRWVGKAQGYMITRAGTLEHRKILNTKEGET
jgi:Mn-dependent DtxR family transcriptional regulator